VWKVDYQHNYRSISQRNNASKCSQLYAWVTNGIEDLRILKKDMNSFLNKNTEYKNGRINA